MEVETREGTIPDHLYLPEVRAIETCLKWRLFKQRVPVKKCLHLVDSMVSLQVLNKGHSSSHKLRALTKRVAALLISGRIALVLAYTHAFRSPADKPSRVCLKRKWSNV